MRYLALLRGINVGGQNRVDMNQLKKLFIENNFSEVKTYLNTGNIIFNSDVEDSCQIQVLLAQEIAAHFQLEIPVMVISKDELVKMSAQQPEWWGSQPETKHNAIFVVPPANVIDIVKEVGAHKPEYEQIAYLDKIIFWSAPMKTFSRSRWAKIVSKKSAYQAITIRNSNTFKKLVELISEA